ncbi:MAG: GspH/FimT family protein [Phycisphaerae bacterium]|nr:GspH/FimT family protein [Phycisphaerae bacterium]
MMKKMKNIIPGFTLVELTIVLVIIAIIAAIAVPMYSSAASIQLKTAATLIASDLEYAKSMAVSMGQTYQIVFDTAAESYSLQDSAGAVISHPVRVKQNYEIKFALDGRLNKVDIVSTTFGAGNTIKFNYLGTPLDGLGANLNNGVIVLSAQSNTMTVKIEPVTGYITIE